MHLLRITDCTFFTIRRKIIFVTCLIYFLFFLLLLTHTKLLPQPVIFARDQPMDPHRLGKLKQTLCSIYAFSKRYQTKLQKRQTPDFANISGCIEFEAAYSKLSVNAASTGKP